MNRHLLTYPSLYSNDKEKQDIERTVPQLLKVQKMCEGEGEAKRRTMEKVTTENGGKVLYKICTMNYVQAR